MITSQFFPEWKQLRKPWSVIINILQTHFDTKLDFPLCKKRLKEQRCLGEDQSFDCADQLVELYLKAFRKAGLLDNTEIIIYGDHPHNYFHTPDTLHGVWIPSQPKNASLNHKNSSIFDIMPTALDLLGIQTHPPFPFGASFLSDKVGQVPTLEDRVHVFNFYRKHGYSAKEFLDPGLRAPIATYPKAVPHKR